MVGLHGLTIDTLVLAIYILEEKRLKCPQITEADELIFGRVLPLRATKNRIIQRLYYPNKMAR